MKINRKNPFEDQSDDAMSKLRDDLALQEVNKLLDLLPQEEVSKFNELFESDDAQRKISADDWAQTHPMDMKCGSDGYYAGLANKISQELRLLNLPDSFPEDGIREISAAAAAYLEDLVSGTGVWNSIRTLYRETYGTWLPFYDCGHDDYFSDDINKEDLKFLVWQTSCRLGQPKGVLFSPISSAVERMSEIIFDILVDEFDHAPVATRMRDYVRNTLKEGDFFKVRTLAKWLRDGNRLTAVPTQREFQDEMIDEIIKQAKENDNIPFDMIGHVVYQYTCEMIWEYCGPLGCSPSKYLAAMAREKGFDKTAGKLDAFSWIKNDSFEIESYDKKMLRLKDAAGDVYPLAVSSLNMKGWPKHCKGYCGSLVRYGDMWHLNGMGTFSEEPDFKGDNEFIPVKHLTSSFRKLMDDIVAANKGRRIFYGADMKEISKILGLSNGTKGTDNDTGDTASDFVLMLSEEEGFVLLRDEACNFKDKTNPYYDKSVAKAGGALRVVMTCAIPDDIAVIIQDKKLLPDAMLNVSKGKRAGKNIMQDNLRFFIGFYRTRVSRPSDLK